MLHIAVPFAWQVDILFLGILLLLLRLKKYQVVHLAHCHVFQMLIFWSTIPAKEGYITLNNYDSGYWMISQNRVLYPKIQTININSLLISWIMCIIQRTFDAINQNYSMNGYTWSKIVDRNYVKVNTMEKLIMLQSPECCHGKMILTNIQKKLVCNSYN